MQILTNAEIQDRCITIINSLPSWYLSRLPYFQFLYATGCRPEEPLDISRFYKISPTIIEFVPLKNNNHRRLYISELPIQFTAALEDNRQFYDSYRRRQLNFIMNKLIGLNKVYVDNKEVGLYLFRYNYVKQLFESGFNYDDITIIMGWHSVDMAFKYVSKKLYVLR